MNYATTREQVKIVLTERGFDLKPRYNLLTFCFKKVGKVGLDNWRELFLRTNRGMEYTMSVQVTDDSYLERRVLAKSVARTHLGWRLRLEASVVWIGPYGEEILGKYLYEVRLEVEAIDAVRTAMAEVLC